MFFVKSFEKAVPMWDTFSVWALPWDVGDSDLSLIQSWDWGTYFPAEFADRFAIEYFEASLCLVLIRNSI